MRDPIILINGSYFALNYILKKQEGRRKKEEGKTGKVDGDTEKLQLHWIDPRVSL
ncbi:MAG: hypothetical protein F6K23_32905 [Okeania sp. SIO2C9]|nr:hypothetical protein [Okeania sp. SIO2C9]